VIPTPATAPAPEVNDPATCWYLIRNEGKQVPCGADATHRRASSGPGGWFPLCGLHARVVHKDSKGKAYINRITVEESR
jgi:hypothetical protein